jgi:uroporphyrinogen decarboxylase
MTKIERVDAVLKGGEPDRPPVCLWYHFGLQHTSGETFAKAALEYFEHYDLDFLKVMNDYFYPMPAGVDEIKTVKDLARIGRLEADRTPLREQLKALRLIGKQLKKRAYFIDTVFDPWQVLLKSVCGEHLSALAKEAPRQLTKALGFVTDTLIDYCRRSIQTGSSGIFLSVLASREVIDHKLFLNFAKPAAMKLMNAIKFLAPMNVLHAHGAKIFTSDILDFPASVISYEDRLPGNPSIEEMKKRFPGAIMGGIDNTQVVNRTYAFIKNNVCEGLRRGGKSRFFLANGCSIPSWLDARALQIIVETAKTWTPGADAKPTVAVK